MDIHAIADDWRANPITSWSIKDVKTNTNLAHVRLVEGRYGLYGLSPTPSFHDGLRSAMREAESLLTCDALVH